MSDTRVLRVGFVGCGTHATHNLQPMLRYARCRLAAVCDLNESLARRNADMFNARGVYTDYRAMLDAEDLQAMLVCGPFDLHYQAATEALSRGLPVFVEKPPAPDLESARKLVDLARAKKTFFMTGFMKRYASTYGKVAEALREGRWALSSGLFRYTHWSFIDLNGTLLAMAIHHIDLAVSYFGRPVAVTSTVHMAGTVPCVNITLHFADGRWATVIAGCHGPRIQERVELYGRMDGKDGYVVIDNVMHMELHTGGQNGIDVCAPTLPEIRPSFDLDDIKVWRPDLGIPNMGQCSTFAGGYAGELRAFVDAVLNGTRPEPSNEQCLPAMQVLDAVLKKPNGTTELEILE